MARSSSPLRSLRVRHTGIGCLVDEINPPRKCSPRQHVLFRIEPFRAEQPWQEGYHPVVRKKHGVFFEQETARLERLEFSLEFLHPHDTGYELDVMLLEQVLVLPLRIFRDQTYARRPGIDQWVF